MGTPGELSGAGGQDPPQQHRECQRGPADGDEGGAGAEGAAVVDRGVDGGVQDDQGSESAQVEVGQGVGAAPQRRPWDGGPGVVVDVERPPQEATQGHDDQRWPAGPATK